MVRDAAFAAFVDLLGAENVIRDPDVIAQAERTTYRSNTRVQAILRPGTTEEVCRCVRIANEQRAPLYPVSRGKNWGYGSRVPPRDCAAILDLSRLDRITNFSAPLGHVTVQPGVTFAELSTFLRSVDAPFFATVHGGPDDASVLAHVLERGLGKGPYADRWLYSCGFEVVLPTGELVHTSFGHFEGAACTPVARAGPGPYLDGLFTQSNLGIVTELTIWLVPRAEHGTSFMFGIREDASLERLVDALRRLKLEGTLRSSCLVANDVRRLTFSGHYPWEEAGGVTPLPAAIRKKLGGGLAWSGDGGLYSPSAAQLAADKARIRAVLGEVVDVLVWGDEPQTANAPIPPEVLKVVHGLNTGQPIRRSAATAYWRKRSAPPEALDPDRDGCGFISFSPAVPFEGRHVRAAVSTLAPIMEAHGFDPSLGLNCVGERSIDLTPMILFDREIPGEDERAMACHDEMMAKLGALGYFPYRLCTAGMEKLPPSRDGYPNLIRTLKRALDPEGILAPGRYDYGANDR